jgi:PAS domain S-box-containing protein
MLDWRIGIRWKHFGSAKLTVRLGAGLMTSSSTRERYLSALVTVQQLLLRRQTGEHFCHLLPVLGEVAGAGRVYYFENHLGDHGCRLMSMRAEWCRPGIVSNNFLVSLQNIPAAQAFPEAYEVLRNGQALSGPRAEMPANVQTMMDATGARSIVLLPIEVDGQLHGVIGFDNCTAETPWRPDEVDLLRGAAGAMAVAIERHRAESQFRELADKLNSYIEKSPLGVIEWDQDFRIASWSHRAEEMFGWRAEEVLGKTWSEWHFVYDEDVPRVTTVTRNLSLGSTPFSFSHNRNYLKSGGVGWFDWYNSVIRAADGTIKSTLSLVLDVTERVQAEEEVRRSMAQAAQTEKMAALGQMASGVAHDFNNALTVIIGKTELLLARSSLDDKTRTTLHEILTAGLDAAATVRRMQQFVRARGGDIDREIVDLGRLLREVSEFTRLRWSDQALARGAVIELGIEQTVPALVRAEPSELRDILTNLIFNAVDAMPRGGRLTLAAGVEHGRAYFRVADTGVGMDAETRKRCCEPFFTTKGVEGTGLGLAVSWSVAQRLGGEFIIESEPNHGTTVTMWLPAVSATMTNASPRDSTVSAGPPRRILVIEDHHEVNTTLCHMLRQLNHEAIATPSGADGLSELQRSAFDMVITDLGMPGLDGWEVARQVKLHAPTLPVILLTGWADQLQANGDGPTGVDLILAKPVSLEQLRGAIGRLFASDV